MKSKTKTLIILSGIFLSMLILNLITPLIMDDFSYAFGTTGRVQNLKDIFDFQIWYYLHWGGRNVAHTLAQFFLMNNKLLFNIMNSAIYTLLIYLIYRIIKGKNEDHPIYPLLIHLYLWFFTPVFGQAFIWLTGSCNYLWTTTIIMIFLNLFLHFNASQKKYNILKCILFGVLGIITGWTNENSGTSLVFILISYIIVKKLIEKEKINSIQWFGILGTIIGFVIMIVAPGNFIRSSGFDDNRFFIIKWIERAISITQTAESYLLIPIIILVIILSCYFYNKQKIRKEIYLFIIGTIIAIYSMVASPTFPERSWTMVIIYMAIISGIILYDLKLKNNLKKIVIIDISIIVSLTFINSYILTFKDSYGFYNTWQERIKTIEEGKKKGIQEYEFETFYTTRKQSASFALGDLYPDKNDSNNQSYARYFGVKYIKAKEVKEP